MKIAIAQINTTIGDFDGNAAKIIERIRWAEGAGVDIVVFPELAVCGYPPRDLLEKPSFISHNLQTVDMIARKTRRVGVVLGFVSVNESAEGRGLYNSAGLLHDGAVRFVQHKALLPEYDVFDEVRHFEPAKRHEVYSFAGSKIGLTLCEDLWSLHSFRGRRLYKIDPMEKLSAAGAELIINLSASPFTLGKQSIRRKLMCSEAQRYGLPIIYCNMVGGNDELVFDGRSFTTNAAGHIVCEAKAFEEDSLIVDSAHFKPLKKLPEFIEEEEVRRALILGLHDYMRKCGFERAVIGLSGGIDSAVVAAIACEAIGSKKVTGVMMPSPYTLNKSTEDAKKLAANLGMTTLTIPISPIYEAYRSTLGYKAHAKEVSLAEENMQARIRGNMLMAISNKEKALVLSTGNKSELSVGYCTLYGDMAGGLALISDLPKTFVYALARHINKDGEVIPLAIIERPPTAELKPDQKDEDLLPPYDVLDSIIKLYVEERQSVEAIIAEGFDKKTVNRVAAMIDCNEYKRRQAPPGIKITSKAFGVGRRFPIAWQNK